MALLNLGMALLVVALLALLVRSERRDVNAPGVSLLRCLFPAWRFFESIEPGAQLSYRAITPDAEPGPWLAAASGPAPQHALLLNAAGNLRLACRSLVEQLESELEGQPARPTELVTYRLVQALVQYELRAHGAAPGRYQFRLCVQDAERFVSPVHAVGES